MSFERKCGPCYGKGYYGYDIRDTCEVCEGHGINVFEGTPEQYKTCGPCYGKGYYGYDVRDTCQVCRGLGIQRPKKKGTANHVIGRIKSGKAGTKYHLFIAHASEDKAFVTPLAKAFVSEGLRVWYDDFVLRAGDSLRREIDKGLAQSDYGIVVLSHSFFNKHYPQKELDGLTAKERLNKKVIIPIWHQITRNEVEAYSPTLADIVAVRSDQPIEHVVEEILEAIS